MDIVLKQLIKLSENSRLKKMREYVQHGNTSCLLHTFAVAYYSVKLSNYFNLGCNRRELARGALLHDYFLYDWHDGLKERRIHGFTHPAAALKNAECDFKLTNLERDIIKKHMFPLTVIPPSYKESWVVCLVDKACSLYETLKKNPYPTLRFVLKNNNMS